MASYLTFSIQEIKDQVTTKVNIKSRNIKQDGSDDFEMLSTTDHDDYFTGLIKSISYTLFEAIIAPMARDVSNAGEYIWDEEGGEIMYMFDYPENFDTNLANPLLYAIMDCMVEYCVFDWLKLNNYPYQSAEKDYLDKLQNCISIANRRKVLTRSYKLY